MRTKHENKPYVPQFKHPGGQNPTKKKHLSKTKAESQIPACAGVCRWLRKNLNLSGYLVCISYANISYFHEEPVIKPPKEIQINITYIKEYRFVRP